MDFDTATSHDPAFHYLWEALRRGEFWLVGILSLALLVLLARRRGDETTALSSHVTWMLWLWGAHMKHRLRPIDIDEIFRHLPTFLGVWLLAGIMFVFLLKNARLLTSSLSPVTLALLTLAGLFLRQIASGLTQGAIHYNDLFARWPGTAWVSWVVALVICLGLSVLVARIWPLHPVEE